MLSPSLLSITLPSKPLLLNSSLMASAGPTYSLYSSSPLNSLSLNLSLPPPTPSPLSLPGAPSTSPLLPSSPGSTTMVDGYVWGFSGISGFGDFGVFWVRPFPVLTLHLQEGLVTYENERNSSDENNHRGDDAPDGPRLGSETSSNALIGLGGAISMVLAGITYLVARHWTTCADGHVDSRLRLWRRSDCIKGVVVSKEWLYQKSGCVRGMVVCKEWMRTEWGYLDMKSISVLSQQSWSDLSNYEWNYGWKHRNLSLSWIVGHDWNLSCFVGHERNVEGRKENHFIITWIAISYFPNKTEVSLSRISSLLTKHYN